jgi:rhodanese-related sulfurtransferase
LVEMKECTAREAHDRWEKGEVAIVDVREQVEFDTTHVDGVPLIPMSELASRTAELPTDRPLVIMCRSGARSGKVTEQLNAEGTWGEVTNLAGGIIGWAADGLPYQGEPPA